MELSDLVEQLATPGKLVGHLSYALLVASMLMRSMRRLRIVAIAAGLTSMAYGLFWLRDPVTVIWETIFVLANVAQLLILAAENRRARFDSDEAMFVGAALKGVEPAHAHRFLKLGDLRTNPSGTVLTREGEPVERLVFVLEGKVRIDHGGTTVGFCRSHDFIGEIGFLSGTPASATATAEHETRTLCFPRAPLAKLLARDPSLANALEASFNRNLIAKLVASNVHNAAAPLDSNPASA